MDTGKHSIEKMLQDRLMPAEMLCGMMQNVSKGKFTENDFYEQFRMRIEVDGREMMGVDSTQDEFFSSVARMSQCDHCGVLRTNLPKMLTCSGCRGLHYCTKTCQKEHWKAAHKTMCTEKNISKDAFRVGDFCSKMLSVLSMGVDTEHETYVNADNSRLRDAFLKYGCRDHIYMPVFQDDTLMYIPMPLKFVAYLIPGKPQRVMMRKDFNGKSQRVAIAMQTKVLDVKDMHGLFFILKDTFVMLP